MKIDIKPCQKILLCLVSALTWGLVGLVPGVQAADPPTPSPTAEEQKGPPPEGGDVQERGIQRGPMPINPLPPSRLPHPVLAFTGVILSEKLTGPTRHKLAITNHAAYPNTMFAPAPNLPPCGQNTNASRTWVNIYDATTKSYIHGFCTLRSSGDLVNLWFDVRHGEARPSQVYVVLDDRQANKKYISNPVTLP